MYAAFLICSANPSANKCTVCRTDDEAKSTAIRWGFEHLGIVDLGDAEDTDEALRKVEQRLAGRPVRVGSIKVRNADEYGHRDELVAMLAALRAASRDLLAWLNLAERQRDSSGCPDRDPLCATSAGIDQTRNVLAAIAASIKSARERSEAVVAADEGGRTAAGRPASWRPPGGL